MKINKIHIDGFGKFSQLPIEDFQSGLTIFKGANEAGKSTLLAFIRRMLFGFPGNRTSINKYPPLGGGNHGGKLVFTTDAGERCTIERYAGRQNVANVTLPDGSNGGVDELSDLLGNADKDIFENIYAFGLDELQKFDTLNNESLRDKLYSIGAGLGSVSISDVQKSLDQQQRKMYTKTGKKASINVLFTSIKTLDDTINDLEKDQDEYDL
ncbi:MAG: AAA family ATPase, partial [Methanosarcinales archaeon]|nr:AAA family ATPase [Methanosarcinales archaeon]